MIFHRRLFRFRALGTILVAEGLLAAIPEFRTLIAELEGVQMPSTVEKALPELSSWSAALFRSLPEFIQKQLLLERPHI